MSFEASEYTVKINTTDTLRLLNAIKESGKSARFYQASTSELYGKVAEVPQKEAKPFHPRSSCAMAKLYIFWVTRNYREVYRLHASNEILFNYKLPCRGEIFVTRKKKHICKAGWSKL